MWFLQPGITFQDLILRILAILFITFVILPFHEFSHAFIAYKLGDSTAKYEGRLTLNPLMHFSPLGAVAMLLCDFGWAKPVPINPLNFKNPRRDMAIVALAGPISNLLAALLGGLVLNLVPFIHSSSAAVMTSVFLYHYISINTSLAAFNFIPVPPLDGFKMLSAFIPEKYIDKIYKNINFITWGLIILLLFGFFDMPVLFLQKTLCNLVIRLTHIPFKI